MRRRIPAALGWLVLSGYPVASVIVLALSNRISVGVLAVLPQSIGVVQETMQPAHGSLWLRSIDYEARV